MVVIMMIVYIVFLAMAFLGLLGMFGARDEEVRRNSAGLAALIIVAVTVMMLVQMAWRA